MRDLNKIPAKPSQPQKAPEKPAARNVLKKTAATARQSLQSSPAASLKLKQKKKPESLPVGLTSLIPRNLPVPEKDRSKFKFTEWIKHPGMEAFYPVIDLPKVGKLKLTGGFMETAGHGRKPDNYPAIFADGKLRKVGPESKVHNFNIGIDYVTLDGDKVNAWHGGEVVQASLDRAYGNRVVIKTNINFKYNGKLYKVHQAYGHLKKIDTKVGNNLKQGQKLGIMGGTGNGGQKTYPDHVDLRTFIIPDGAALEGAENKWIEISPNLLEKQLQQKL